MWFVWLDREGWRKARDSADQRDRVTEEPWWWKSGRKDTNDVRTDKKCLKFLKNYRSNLTRVMGAPLTLILA